MPKTFSFEEAYKKTLDGLTNQTLSVFNLSALKKARKSTFEEKVSEKKINFSKAVLLHDKCLVGIVNQPKPALKTWDLITGMDETLVEPSFKMHDLALLWDGRVVTCNDDYTLTIWELTTRSCVKTLKGHTGGINSVAILPDGRIVSGSSDKTIKIWNISTDECVTLQGHLDTVCSVAVRPDGTLVSGCKDAIKVWDLVSQTCVQTFPATVSYVSHMANLPDGGAFKDAIIASLPAVGFVNDTLGTPTTVKKRK